jgi:hypothetical protein
MFRVPLASHHRGLGRPSWSCRYDLKSALKINGRLRRRVSQDYRTSVTLGKDEFSAPGNLAALSGLVFIHKYVGGAQWS